MTSDGTFRGVSDESPSPLSAAARIIYVSPDQIGTWRLRMSVLLDDARWYLDHGRKTQASQCVRGARFCHHEIMRIRFHVRARVSGRPAPDLQQIPIVPIEPAPPSTAEHWKSRLAELSRSERKYIGLLADGKSRADAAVNMGIKRSSIDVYHSTASRKLGIEPRALQAYAVEKEWRI